MLSKKYYKAIAEKFQETITEAKEDSLYSEETKRAFEILVNRLCYCFKSDNFRFQPEKFKEACFL